MSTTTKTPAKKTPAKKATAAKRTSVPAPEAPASSTTALDAITATSTTAHVVEISLDLIEPHPANPRKDLGDVTELADSIRTHGIRQNLVLVPHPDTPGRHRTVIGHRRAAAAALAGLATVPAVVDHDLDDRAQLELMLLENIQRTDLTPIEEATGYQGLLDLGSSVADVSRKVGRSRKTIESRLALVTLPERARTVVHSHQATLGEAELLAKTLARTELTADAAAKIEAAFGTPNFEHTVERAVHDLDKAAQRVAALVELEATGVRVLDSDSYAPSGVKPLSDLAAAGGEPKPKNYYLYQHLDSLTPEEHAGCPGHVAWLYSNWNGLHIRYGCSQWKQACHLDRDQRSAATKPKGAPDRKTVIENNKAAVAAEAVRRRWLMGYLKPERRLDADAVVYVAAVLTALPSEHFKDSQLMTSLFPDVMKIPRATPAGATVYLAALAATRVERVMGRDFWQAGAYSTAIVPHLSKLAEWGYELSELEQEYVKKHTPKGA